MDGMGTDWFLIGGWTNPCEKYARQIRSFPQINTGENKKMKPPPRIGLIGIHILVHYNPHI